MPESLIDLAFGAATLNDPEMIEKFGTNAPGDGFAQDLFLQLGRDHSPEPGEGNVAKWYEVQLSRKPAPFGSNRSPAVVIEGVGGDLKTAAMADIRIASDPIPLDEITSQRAAQNWLAAESRDKRKRVRIARELLAWMTLKGAVTVNGTTFPGSKVSFSFTQAVTGLAPAASWATAGTKVASTEFDRLQTTYHDACGLEAKRLVVDNNVHKYLRQNTEVQDLYSAYQPADKKGTVLAPVGTSFEFEGFHFDVTRAKYDLNGTLTKYLGDDGLIALPGDEELSMVLGYAQGHGAIPSQAIGREDLAGMGFQAPQAGDYAYAYMIPEPAAVVVVYGWRGLFFLTFPEAVGYDDSVITP